MAGICPSAAALAFTLAAAACDRQHQGQQRQIQHLSEHIETLMTSRFPRFALCLSQLSVQNQKCTKPECPNSETTHTTHLLLPPPLVVLLLWGHHVAYPRQTLPSTPTSCCLLNSLPASSGVAMLPEADVRFCCLAAASAASCAAATVACRC